MLELFHTVRILSFESPLHQPGTIAPDTAVVHGSGQITARRAVTGQLPQQCDIPAQCPQDDRRRGGFSLQSTQRPKGRAGIPGQGGVGETEGTVAGAGQHAVHDGCQIDAVRCSQQLEFVDFLNRRQKIALHPVGQ